MVLDIIIQNLTNYVFGSRLLFGLGIVLMVVVGSLYARIDKSALLLLLAPLVLVLGKVGYLPHLFTVLIFVGIFILWGIMFKLILGKR